MEYLIFLFIGLTFLSKCFAQDDVSFDSVDLDIGASREAVRTDDDVIRREEEAIKSDELNVAQIKELREKSEHFAFQAEVNRMMKLIINSLYRNKEIFLRELISNASDALDKIRLLSLTNRNALHATNDLVIKVKADKENHILHIIDTGIGMTRNDLEKNLGTIAKSGTADFLNRMQESATDLNDMIGQFGVGFYSVFLVADTVLVTTKNNDDKQYIWESDSEKYTIFEDPRGNTLKRGTQVSLYLKEEAFDFLVADFITNLIKKYSQFITFPIYVWTSKPVETNLGNEEVSDEATVETTDETTKARKMRTVWDWELTNSIKPIWTRVPSTVTEDEYNAFYKSLTKDSRNPLAKIHFVGEGEVTFKSLLYVPQSQPEDIMQKYGTKTDNIKLYVRRIFITDEFNDMLPNYIRFVQGVVDSDDLPLNVSRETLQQHKLINVIKKKLIRKALDMFLNITKEEYPRFWKEYSTNIKLGVVEDNLNRAKLSKLLMFHSSHSKNLTSLADYVARGKESQDVIYFIAGATLQELENSPFVERLLAIGYEVLYLIEAVDEYCINALPEFGLKRFQNVAKEDFSLPPEDGRNNNQLEKLRIDFDPLIKWLEDILKTEVMKVTISERLIDSPCALVASVFGWTGNMERLAVSNAHKKAQEAQNSPQYKTKKIFEINPNNPLIKELLQMIKINSNDETAKEMAIMLHRTAILRSGYMLNDVSDFTKSVETMMMLVNNISKEKHYSRSADIKVENHFSDGIHDDL